MPSLTFHIETFGCQMNDRDSEIMAQLLSEFCRPAPGLFEADVVMINTCSIRQKAEQKAFSLLGTLKQLKSRRPEMIIGVAGCVAQQEGSKLLARLPYVDLVLGTQNIYKLPELIAEIKSGSRRRTAVSQSSDFEIPPYLPDLRRGPAHKRFVTIMQGCNNFCTYCVVPYTRGREVSRRMTDILAEIRHLTSHGVKEITLLGQNVNSYGHDLAREVDFSTLLREAAEVKGLRRLRFTTSNPKDLNDKLIQCFAEIDILCPHFHLPVQSGSNDVLKRMNRHYTIEHYRDRVAALRAVRSDIALTTDIIIGFPGENEEDFQATMNLVRDIRYHGAYSFKYSDRPQARSAAFADKVSEEVKSRRLSLLQEEINRIAAERNKEYVGRVQEVMVEGKSRHSPGQWSGRAAANHIVNFKSNASLNPGDIIDITITEACLHSLRGQHD